MLTLFESYSRFLSFLTSISDKTKGISDGLRSHVLILGSAGIGKTELAKRQLPQTDQESHRIDRTVKMRLEPCVREREDIDTILELPDDELVEVWLRLNPGSADGGTGADQGGDVEGQDGGEAVVPQNQDGVKATSEPPVPMNAEDIRDGLRQRLVILKNRERGILEALPNYVWLQGNITARGLYELLYYYRHEHFRTLILNDVSIVGAMATLLKQVLEKEGARTVSSIRAEKSEKEEKVKNRFILNARIVVIANKFSPKDDEDWDAVLDRLFGCRFAPTPREIIEYMSPWFPDEGMLSKIKDDLAAGNIVDLNLRRCLKTAEFKRTGALPEEIDRMLAEAYKPTQEDHLTEDESAVLDYARKRGLRRIRRVEVYKALNRFKGLGATEGKQRLQATFAKLVADHHLIKIEPTDGSRLSKAITDLYQVLSATERADKKRLMAQMLPGSSIEVSPPVSEPVPAPIIEPSPEPEPAPIIERATDSRL